MVTTTIPSGQSQRGGSVPRARKRNTGAAWVNPPPIRGQDIAAIVAATGKRRPLSLSPDDCDMIATTLNNNGVARLVWDKADEERRNADAIRTLRAAIDRRRFPAGDGTGDWLLDDRLARLDDLLQSAWLPLVGEAVDRRKPAWIVALFVVWEVVGAIFEENGEAVGGSPNSPAVALAAAFLGLMGHPSVSRDAVAKAIARHVASNDANSPRAD